MHILTTGAAGLIGYARAVRLRKRGERITGLYDLKSSSDVRCKRLGPTMRNTSCDVESRLAAEAPAAGGCAVYGL
jgi:nucleoside-diphosphate-sugar epimerase